MNDTLLNEAIELLVNELDDILQNDPESAIFFLDTMDKIFNNPLMKNGNAFIIVMANNELNLLQTKARKIDIDGRPLRINLQSFIDGLKEKAKEIAKNKTK